MSALLQRSARGRGVWVCIVVMGFGGCLPLGLGEAKSQTTVFDEPAANGQELERVSNKIGPQDVVQISVWQDETLSREVVVFPDGSISFPLAVEVRA